MTEDELEDTIEVAMSKLNAIYISGYKDSLAQYELELIEYNKQQEEIKVQERILVGMIDNCTESAWKEQVDVVFKLVEQSNKPIKPVEYAIPKLDVDALILYLRYLGTDCEEGIESFLIEE